MHPYVAQQIMDSRQRDLIAEAKRARRDEVGSGRTRHKPAKGGKGQTRRGS